MYVVTKTAVLTANDGSLPEPGFCEPATAILDVTGAQRRYLRLAASSARRLRGTDGWISQILATEGPANVEAIDT